MKKIVIAAFIALCLAPVITWAQGVKVAATIFPLSELARAVVGERGEVIQIIPPGADPHSWAPTPSLHKRLESVQIFFYTGPSLEPWAHKLLQGLDRRPRVVDATSIVSKASGEGVISDPHIWLDLSLDILLVRALTKALIEEDPAGKPIFQANCQRVVEEMKELDRRFSSTLGRCRHKTLIVASHAAFGHLARRYTLKQVALEGISPDAHTSPKRMAEIIQLIRREHIPAIFYLKGESDKLAQVLAKETGSIPIPLSNGAILTREDVEAGKSFLQLMEEDLAALSRGLQCHN